MQSKRKTALVAVGTVIAVSLAVYAALWSRGEQVEQAAGMPQAWYTVDDGRTWFPDRADKVVPFDYQGKPAYRCHVWTCDGGKTEFVSHLERLNAAARKQLAGKETILPWEIMPGSEEVKLPRTGDNGWVGDLSPQFAQITAPRCHDGKGGIPQPVRAK